MDYSLRELECFIAVAEELSFTRAARRLHLAQPPLSRHIRTLEEKIGASLFIREPRRVSLTAAGSALYEEARYIPSQLARAGEAARRQARGETARLRLGFVSAVMNDDLVAVFRHYRQQHPGVEIMLHDLPPSEQVTAIAEGKLDGGFVGLVPAQRPPGIQFMGWQKEALLCYLPQGHALAAQRVLSLAALKAEPFVAVAHEAAPAFAGHVRALCQAAGFRPKIVLESTRAQAVALMVAAGSGVAILPAALERVVQGAVDVRPLKGSPTITHVFACQQGRLNGPLADLARSLRGRKSS